MSAAPEMVHYDGTPLEQRAEIASLDGLHQQRRFLMAQLAPLKALHGHNGLFDARRKQLCEALKVKHRMELAAAGQKATDNAVDALAHADPQYAALLDAAERDKVQYIQLQVELDEIEERIRSRELELLAYNSEVKLAR